MLKEEDAQVRASLLLQAAQHHRSPTICASPGDVFAGLDATEAYTEVPLLMHVLLG